MTPSSVIEPSSQLKKDNIDLLYGNSLAGILISYIASSGMALGFEQSISFNNKYQWLLCMSLILALRLIDWYVWRRLGNSALFDQRFALIRFRIGAFTTAILWSIYAVLFYEQMDVIQFCTTLIILAAMAGGASTVLAADKLLSASYASLLIIPISVIGIISSEHYQNILGALGLFFAVVMVVSGQKSARFTHTAIQMKHQNEALVLKQSQLVDQIRSHNHELSETVERRTREVVELSNKDPLTELANRTSFALTFSKQLKSMRQNQQVLALLFVDLDGFKAINDQFGHSMGDRVLQAIALRLRARCSNTVKLCRWGGDEFVLTLERQHEDQAASLARQIISDIEKPIMFEQHILNLSATIGISMYPEHSEDAAELILLADQAMYEQKKQDKANICVFSKALHEKLHQEVLLKAALSSAIENGELHLVYQPIHNAHTGEPVFSEALLRWEYQQNLIPPDLFIPIAEKHGLINSIGEWVLLMACRDAAKWSAETGKGVSVNTSVKQLMRPDMVDIVCRALEESKLPAHLLCLEITESIFAEDMAHVSALIDALHDVGVSLAIDDFGTGFSSLAMLQNLSVDTIKIDKSFVHNLEGNGEAIIQATLLIANEFGLDVVAEGVETERQAQMLKTMGITKLQGFYLSKPQRFLS
ncbi:putative bifunctional diguanylate cyclase/phosphodiesterase [Ningiella sp. W23]|uniref:putative bifunctional diguanylate cyclase/phosphodiesterase n=1 Tax=Ningiella sp. W23 TaxID=3023715 RepID=UPI003758212A